MDNRRRQQIRTTTIFRQLILNIIVPVVVAIVALAIYNSYTRTESDYEHYHSKNKLVSFFIEKFLRQQDNQLEGEEQILNDRLEALSDSLVNNYLNDVDNLADVNLHVLARRLGMDEHQEDIYIIDRNGICINTTYEKDLGRNFFEIGEVFRQHLETVFNNKEFVSEKFSIEGSTKKIRKYTYEPTEDGAYIVELGSYSQKANDILAGTKEIFEDIANKYAIKSVDLFIGADSVFSFDPTADMSQDIDVINKVFDLKADRIMEREGKDGHNLYYEYIYMKRENTSLYKGAVIRIVSDRSEDEARVQRTLLNNFLIFLIAITVVIVLIYKKSRVITHPIKKLLDNVNRITEGNLNERAEVEGNNEITRLSEKFNVMLERLEEYYTTLEKKVEERTAEIRRKKEEIEEKNKNIEDSIRYAKRIQNAILPPHDYVNKLFDEYFILYKPKDIVSGDFYWVNQDGDDHMFAVVDCTGHGVPGAFMSIVGHDQLNYATNVKGARTAGDIMNQLNQGVREALRQRSGETSVRDGMDMSLVSINWKTMSMNYGGAYNSIYMFRDGELVELHVDRQAVGGFLDEDVYVFKNYEMDLKKGDMIYLFSDGYQDQFGGPKGKKLKSKRFKELLKGVHMSSPSAQREILDQNLVEWMGYGTEQVDDILLVGIRI